MANIKTAALRGSIPFNYYEDADLAARFAFMQSPSSGLRVSFPPEPTPSRPNEHGGQTAMYIFEITGAEACSSGWFDALRDSILRVGGELRSYLLMDSETGEYLRGPRA